MKIKSTITKRVNDSLANTKKVLTSAIIELLKDAGVENCENFTLAFPVSLTSSKHNKDGYIISKTSIINSVAYCDGVNNRSFIMGEYNGVGIVSDLFMGVGELITLYDAVKDSVKRIEK